MYLLLAQSLNKDDLHLSSLPYIMKYSNFIGVGAAVCLIAVCFAPWVYIEPLRLTLTGFQTNGTFYGMPGLMNVIVSIIAIVCFLLPHLGAKRTNLFICAFNLAWSVRNYLIVTQCQLGECPEKRFGIYALVSLAIVMMLMSLFPKVKVD